MSRAHELDAAEIHRARRAQHAREESRLDLLDTRMTRARVLVAGVGVGFAIGAALGLWPWSWLLWPVAGFLGLVAFHVGQLSALVRSRRGRRFHDDALARMEGRPRVRGDAGARFASTSHPYAIDLDLFGRSGLFPLLDSTRTDAGEERLASWLLDGAESAKVAARQRAIRELAPLVDLRETLALLGDDARARLHPERLVAWGADDALLGPLPFRVTALAFNVLLASAFVAGPLLDLGAWPALALVGTQALFALSISARTGRIARRAEARGSDLEILAGILEELESARFESPRLRAITASLDESGPTLSVEIRRLARRIDLLDARRNQLFAPFAMMALWTTHLALAIESWRQRHGTRLAAALDAVADFEALASLAAYAFENPRHAFPEFVAEGGPLFEAAALGHPLIPEGECVRNDVCLDATRQGLLVSGSNMSGKSTLLRSIGLAVVLAGCGAPVRAERLRLSRLTLGASIVARDSVTERRSRFFAEIERLKQIFDLASDSPPLVFLLDEVLSGTNSHDRRIGAEALVLGLLDRGALGVVTTHDLALAEIVERSGERLQNVHFEDRVEEDEMIFDYRMRPGVVQHSNALALMRRVGLDV